MTRFRQAPELDVSTWLNTPNPITLASLAGKVVLIEAFQMLCPGCVQQGLPQAQRVRAAFPDSDVAVIGLHTVFEHHEAQGTAAALKAFLHEYRIGFPVGIDRPSTAGRTPSTMTAFQMQGTPTLILVDRAGRLRAQHFGHVSDLRLGAEIQALIGESVAPAATVIVPIDPVCTPEGCTVPAS
jgi:hypothetical protein